MTISDLSIELAIVIMIRILAVASPVILLARNIDPTRLGDTDRKSTRLNSSH